MIYSGVSKTLSGIRCSDDDQVQVDSIIDFAIGNPGATNDTTFQLWAYYNAYNRVCKLTIERANQAGPHVTTTVNARDMISIVDAIQKYQYSGYGTPKGKALVNFWIGIAHIFPSQHLKDKIIIICILTDATFEILGSKLLWFHLGPNICCTISRQGRTLRHGWYVRFHDNITYECHS